MSAVTDTPAGTYNIDPSHSSVGFVARHAMITKVRGAFNEIEGTGHFDPANPEASSVSVTIQTASVDTRNGDRDAHLRSADFFDSDTYPTMTFVSTNVQSTGTDTFDITGDLTIKDVTRPVTFATELSGPSIDPWGNTRVGLEGSAVVNRKDWGLTWNAALEAGGVLVSEKVTLELEVSAVRSAD
jgi:polyisoprenoid-binding protein YceI